MFTVATANQVHLQGLQTCPEVTEAKANINVSAPVSAPDQRWVPMAVLSNKLHSPEIYVNKQPIMH